MANFLAVIPRTNDEEGGYSNYKDDEGGITYRGIAFNFFPNWPGWDYINTKIIPNLGRKPKQEEVFDDPVLEDMVHVFWKQEFWDPILGDQIIPQLIAEFLFDWHLNSGIWAVVHLQRILGINADGKFGPETLSSLNKCNYPPVYSALIASRINFYNTIVQDHPLDKIFLNDWLGRVSRFPQSYS